MTVDGMQFNYFLFIQFQSFFKADNQAICGRVGAIDAILRIFNIHLDDPILCANAFYVLMNITVNGI